MSGLGNIIFQDPWYFVLMLIPLLYLYFNWNKGNVSTYTVSSDDRLSAMPILQKLSWLPLIIRTLTLVSVIVALARPQVALEEVAVKGEGIDIMLVMDLSGSMLAEDFDPNRLEVSKQVAKEFISKRKHDRIGLTVFSKEAFTQSPLTTDYEILDAYIDGLQVGMLSDGTAIGMGLSTALNRLIDSDAKSKIAILLTDGENTTGYIDPLTAAEIAREYDIKVYTIGVGSDGQARMPSGKIGSIFTFGVGRSTLDEDLLTEIADMTQGQYFRATDINSLRNIYDRIDQLEKSEIELNSLKRYQDKYRPWIWLALGLFVLDLLLRNFIFNPLD